MWFYESLDKTSMNFLCAIWIHRNRNQYSECP